MIKSNLLSEQLFRTIVYLYKIYRNQPQYIWVVNKINIKLLYIERTHYIG